MDDQSQETDQYKFLEMLIPFLTYYNDSYLKTNLNRSSTTIESNLNFYKTKAKNILGSAKIIINQYNGKIPDNIEELLKLPGVGRKVAIKHNAEFYSWLIEASVS